MYELKCVLAAVVLAVFTVVACPPTEDARVWVGRELNKVLHESRCARCDATQFKFDARDVSWKCARCGEVTY